MGNDIHTVEKLLEKRKRKGKIEYLVQWEGWSKDYNQWEPKSHILDGNLIKEFDARERSLGGHKSCSPKKFRCSSGFYSASESRCSSSVGAFKPGADNNKFRASIVLVFIQMFLKLSQPLCFLLKQNHLQTV